MVQWPYVDPSATVQWNKWLKRVPQSVRSHPFKYFADISMLAWRQAIWSHNPNSERAVHSFCKSRSTTRMGLSSTCIVCTHMTLFPQVLSSRTSFLHPCKYFSLIGGLIHRVIITLYPSQLAKLWFYISISFSWVLENSMFYTPGRIGPAISISQGLIFPKWPATDFCCSPEKILHLMESKKLWTVHNENLQFNWIFSYPGLSLMDEEDLITTDSGTIRQGANSNPYLRAASISGSFWWLLATLSNLQALQVLFPIFKVWNEEAENR